jgi:hypothetical protein
MILELSEKEWIEVIKLVDKNSTGSYIVGEQNKYDDLKTKCYFNLECKRRRNDHYI